MASVAKLAKSSTRDFVELPENQLAFKAVVRLARRSPSPLLMLHGPSGVGKSLLVDWLVHRVIQDDSTRTVQSIPANELAYSIDADVDFKDLLAADVLVVEDLQHLPAHATTLLEKLLGRRRPGAMLLTANAGPVQLKKLPQRVASRLAAGLVVGIDPYSVASRKAILQRTLDAMHVLLETEAFDWLASRPTGGSMRPLLGTLEALRSQSRGRAETWSIDEVKKIHLDPPLGMERIVKRVAETFGVKAKELLGPSRLRTILVPRQVAMYLARDLALLPLPRIGEHFGGRDHTTVLHAVNKIRDAMADDRQLAGTIRQLRLELA